MTGAYVPLRFDAETTFALGRGFAAVAWEWFDCVGMKPSTAFLGGAAEAEAADRAMRRMMAVVFMESPSSVPNSRKIVPIQSARSIAGYEKLKGRWPSNAVEAR